MKALPFNVSILVFALHLGVIITGAISAAILKEFGFNGFWGIFLAVLIALPVGNAIRYGLGKVLADLDGHKGPHPTVFNFPIRMAIGAIVAIPIAVLLNTAISTSDYFEFGALVGALAAFATTTIIAGIFFLRHSLKG